MWGRSGPTKALAMMAEHMRGITDLDPVLAGPRRQGDPRGRRRALGVPLRPHPRGGLRHPDQGRPGPPPPRHRRLPGLHGGRLRRGPRAPGRHGGLPLRRRRRPGGRAGPGPRGARRRHRPGPRLAEEAARRAEVAQALPVAERLYSQALRLAGTDRLGPAGPPAAGPGRGRAPTCGPPTEARADVDEAHALALALGDEAMLARSAAGAGRGRAAPAATWPGR